MAEIVQKGTPKNGKIRVTKQSIRIDMTPMVDLAFLLLTFFILTSTLIKSQMLPVVQPEKGGSVPAVKKESVLNFVLAEGDKVYWWEGLSSTPQLTDYSEHGLKKILSDRAQRIPDLVVIIKPRDNSKYQNTVDILDEIVKLKIQHYTIADLTADDLALIGDDGSF